MLSVWRKKNEPRRPVPPPYRYPGLGRSPRPRHGRIRRAMGYDVRQRSGAHCAVQRSGILGRSSHSVGDHRSHRDSRSPRPQSAATHFAQWRYLQRPRLAARPGKR
ncbi:MAG: hypothetical protein [Caudoviricetes sp.]|nr:MAG: hypothetical protein [Caudoviricetes sp.]